ncbi:Ig-like domain-containing protein [Paenibacillus sp. LHD-117]|uniref:Ig-like domain-containing protein n=1 Tax=Paenibacillus sp. LHD-117 TaxID=3071412 RepID=UPI0027E19840|nr:S-layer homology domain-containing protein [Paenibacillus sp. LHD-117]MDQ6417808.1 Ig-like domain-containing protein [Paenibacillus sp. LHD-117]
MRKLSGSRLAGLFLLLFMFASYSTANAESVQVTDINGHEAEADIREWLDKGIVKGYTDQTFRPDNEVSRAEFVSLVNRAFRYMIQEKVDFKDLKPSDWEYPEVQKAIAYGYINGFNDRTFRSNLPISKQESAMILSKIVPPKADDSLSASISFQDGDRIPSWSKAAIESVVSQGIMVREEDGTFAPKRLMTRAETVVAIKNAWEASAVSYDDAGTYGTNKLQYVHSDVTIHAEDVTLRNMHIFGDLILSEDIGDGEVYLKQIKVEGVTRIEGGGENSVHLVDSRIGRLEVNREDAPVRVVAEGSTSIQDTQVRSSAVLEKEGSGKGFVAVNIVPASNRDAGARNIVFSGDFDHITVSGNIDSLTIRSGRIGTLDVQPNIEVNDIQLHKDAAVQQLDLKSKTRLSGEGTIADIQLSREAESSDIPDSMKPAAPAAGGGGGGAAPSAGGGSPGGGVPGGGTPGGGTPGGGTPGPGPTEPTTATVTGTLFYKEYDRPSPLPISTQRVELRGVNGTTETYIDITTRQGQFTFKNVLPGTYTFNMDLGIILYYSEPYTVVAGQNLTLPNQIVEEEAPEPSVGEVVYSDIGYIHGSVFYLEEPFMAKVETEDGTRLRTFPEGQEEWKYDPFFSTNLFEHNPGLVLNDGDKLYVTFYTAGGWSSGELEITVVERPKTATPQVNTVYDDTKFVRGTLEDWGNAITLTKLDGTVISSYHNNLGNSFSLYIPDSYKLKVGEQLLFYAQANNKRKSDPVILTVMAPTVVTANPTVQAIVYEDDTLITGTAEGEAAIVVKRSDGTVIGEGTADEVRFGGDYSVRLTEPLVAGETLYITAKGYEMVISEPTSFVVQTRPLTDTPLVEGDVYYDLRTIVVKTVDQVRMTVYVKEMDGTIIGQLITSSGSASINFYYGELVAGRQYQVTALAPNKKESAPFVFTALQPSEITPVPTLTGPAYAEAGYTIRGISEPNSILRFRTATGTFIRDIIAGADGKFGIVLPNQPLPQPGDQFILSADAERKLVSDNLVITLEALTEQSSPVSISGPVYSGGSTLIGSASPGSKVSVYREDGTLLVAGIQAGNSTGQWYFSMNYVFFRGGDRFYVVAKESGRLPSAPVYFTLQTSPKSTTPFITSELSEETRQIHGTYDINLLGANDFVTIYVVRNGSIIGSQSFQKSAGAAFAIDLHSVQLTAGETLTFYAKQTGKEVSDPIEIVVG